MESTTEEKIKKLNELFPDADDEFLLEVLTSCCLLYTSRCV